MDANSRAYFAYIFTARWLGFRMDMVVIIVLAASCFVSVAVNEYSQTIGEMLVVIVVVVLRCRFSVAAVLSPEFFFTRFFTSYE